MPRSESVYLDCVSADGRFGFITRLARHTDDGESWLWAHGWSGEVAFSYNRNDLRCGSDATDVDAAHVSYRLDYPDGEATFERWGTAAAPERAVAAVVVNGHRGLTAPEIDGTVPARIEARFSPDGTAGSNLPGRTEALGTVEATLTVDGSRFDLAGRGHFHEQHQDGPRFKVPFTYGTLRGDGAGLVFLIGPRASGGFVRSGAETRPLTRATIDPVGDVRRLTLEVDGGETVVIELARTQHYSLPIHGHGRESSVVVANAATLPALSGCVNDWDPA